LFALLATVLTLGFMPVSPGPFCSGCGDGKDFLGVLMVVTVTVVAFVLSVVWLG
jgi:hypothetical protein